jgi:hypothetical protein
MEAINAIYDGNEFRPTEPIPVGGRYEVVITFVKPVEEDREARRQGILKHFGTWDADDVKLMEEMVAERGNRSRNMEEV